MRTWIAGASVVLFMWLAALSAPPSGAQGFGGPGLNVKAGLSVDAVHPGESFRVAVMLTLPKDLHVNAHVPSEEYLVPTEVKLSAPAGFAVGAVTYPQPHERKFAFTPKPIRVYEGNALFVVPVSVTRSAKPGKAELQGTLSAQPCNSGSCFAPTSVSFSVPVNLAPAGAPTHPANQDLFGATSTAGTGSAGAAGTGATPEAARYPSLTAYAPPRQFVSWLHGALAGAQPAASAGVGRLSDLLKGGSWMLALPLIFLAGLALNLTPCVYPLIPITVSYFGGQSSGSRRRTVTLAALYVLGMAVTYSTLGTLAASTGRLFGSQLQSPWVLAGFAAMMIALGLSMFGLWEIRLPSSLTSHVSARAGYAGAVVMGLLVGLVAAPCVGPAVVALLQVVGQRGDPVVGFAVFFALALGLGVPYLLLGSFSGLIRKLPRSGEWMDGVKHLFGLILFGMALYYLSPLLAANTSRLAMSLYILGAGLYLLLLDRAGRGTRRFFAVKRGLGAIATFAAVWTAFPGAAMPVGPGIAFQPYSEARLQRARAEGRPVLIDFRADWCSACRELEETTFRDPGVAAAMRGVVALRKDMTRSDEEERRLRREYGIVGLPHVVLIPPSRAD